MWTRRWMGVAVVALGTAVAAGCNGQRRDEPTDRADRPLERPAERAAERDVRRTFDEAILQGWPEESQQAADDMVAKYGQPDEVTDRRLVWHDRDPWRTIIIYRDEVEHHFPKLHVDVLEQVIDYDVPPERYDALAEYDGSVIVERTKGALAARCDKEAMNYLALNLAHEIIEDNMTPREARQTYAEAAMAHERGDRHPLTQGLEFDPPDDAGDPDEAIIEE